ncbi:MAG: adenine deaminase [Sarcina sp.]
MERKTLKKLIDIAAGRVKADVVIKNCKVLDVYSGAIVNGDIAFSDDLIAGVGNYEGIKEFDGAGKFAAPGFIDSHIHIESSYVSPEELGRLIVPHGTTTIIADPHEIANVCGFDGINYMLKAAEGTALDIEMMLPSCVPATDFEHSGARIDAKDMIEPMKSGDILGLGEFMNFPGVIAGQDEVLDKLLVAKNNGKVIDGHSPGVFGHELNAYAAARIGTDHECATVEEMQDRISRGLYVLLRQGSACHNLRTLSKGVTTLNSRRCLLCADDCQPKTILSVGHLDNNLRMLVEEGIDPLIAVQMATLNAAECFGLKDRGAIAPGLRADIVLLDNIDEFKVNRVFIAGEEVAKEGKYLLPIEPYSIEATKGSFHVKDFSIDKLKLTINSEKAHVIGILPGGVVTKKEIEVIDRDENNNFKYNKDRDIAKVAVVERHQNTGNVALGLLKGYGIKRGAVALSVAHDSHNIIVVGVTDEDMEFAVKSLIAQGGGIVLVENNKILEAMPMPIAGLMSDKSGEWVDKKLIDIHRVAHEVLEISKEVEPVMTLCFMSLPVIPEIKLTDMGLFDVTKFQFIDIEAE